MIGSAARTAGRPQKQTSSVNRFPAPASGINTTKALGSNDLNYCIYTYNLMPSEYGLKVRSGYREWQIEVENTTGLGVHTLIPFNSVETDKAGDKLFAVTNEGIWDVTAYDTTPVQVVTFTVDTTLNAGYGTYVHYVNQAENDVLFYADNLNGLYSYDQATNAWTNTAILTGVGNPTEASVNFVTVHKNNVWFGITDSATGWYLPILASTGDATAQFFGDKFNAGGVLAGLFSWSVDGGSGVDDVLVIVSKAGDVILYTGAGPDEADWSMKGIYYIGDIPNTPRFGSEQGGELYLLSAYGITSMGDMLRGVDTAELLAGTEGSGMASKIAGYIREAMVASIDLAGWDVALIPSEGAIVVSTPTQGSNEPIQFHYNISTRGWGIWRGVPMQSFAEYNNAVYFGTLDNRIMKMDVDVDDLKITADNPNFNGEDISFSILTAYSPLGAEGVFKRVKLIRPDFISTVKPLYSTQARYDFDTAEGDLIASATPTSGTLGSWDISSWDEAIWAGDSGVFQTIGGAWGYGRYIAIATKGTSRASTRLIGWDVISDVGGPLI